VTAFNATKRITAADVVLTIGTGSGATRLTRTAPVSLGVTERKSATFSLTVPDVWNGDIPYTVELREKEKPLDAIS
jgi:hypothetical protein